MTREPNKEAGMNMQGSLDENLKDGGSSPSHGTIALPATFTPDWLARDMVGLCDIQGCHEVLEPSAGHGALCEAVSVHAGVGRREIHCVELNGDMARSLMDAGYSCQHADFLEWDRAREYIESFDRVVMNPPSHGSAAHVLKAMTYLGFRGRLVALVHSEVVEIVRREKPDIRAYEIEFGTFVWGSSPVNSSLIVWDRS